MGENIKIVFSPSELISNSYIKIVKRLIVEEGIDIFSISESFKNFHSFLNIKIYHLNWFESLDNASYLHLSVDFIKKIGLLFILKIFKKKIVWTMHNRIQHDTSFVIIQWIMNYILLAFSHRIVIHCKFSYSVLEENFAYYFKYFKKKIVYIPHPNYFNEYGKISNKIRSNSDSSLRLLFLGIIRPYKNIELLIESVKCHSASEVKLHIAGNFLSEDYKTTIQSYLKGVDNISTDFRFISDAEIPSIIADYDLLVFPYDLSSILNSGSIILSFSYKKSVISPLIGTLRDFSNCSNFFYYEYSNSAEHLVNLKEQIVNAIVMKNNCGSNYFKTIGENVFDEMVSFNDSRLLSNEFLKLYRGLV